MLFMVILRLRLSLMIGKIFDGIPYPMTVRMSQGGAPRWEIRSSECCC